MIINILYLKKAYFLTIVAVLISGIASGFVQIIAYNQLANGNYKPLYFVTAFLLGMLPGILTSHIGTKLASKENFHVYMFIIKACYAFIVLILTVFQFYNNIISIYLLELLSTAIVGIFYPIIQTIIKNNFTEDELPIASKIDVYIFTVQIIFGIGLGSILINLYSVKILLMVCSLIYGIAGFLHLISKAGLKENFACLLDQSQNKYDLTKKLTFSQNRAYFMMPLLMAIGSPLFSLLPSLHVNYKSLLIADCYTINSVHYLMIARSIGQFLGPLLLPKGIFKRLSMSNLFMFSILLLFCVLYASVTVFTNKIFIFIIVIFAHSLSNIFYCLSFFLLQKEFTITEMPNISAKQYRLNLIICFCSSLIFGYMSDFIGVVKTIWIILFSCLVLIISYLAYIKIYIRGVQNEYM